MSWPKAYTTVKIESVKHDGTLNRRWETNTVLFVDTDRIIGKNHHTMVTNHLGIKTETKRPAFFYFDHRHWFNIVYIVDGLDSYYYCNISSPFRIVNQMIKYTDYDIDIIVEQDFSYRIIDIDEYEINCKKYHYSKEIQQQIKRAVKELEEMIIQRQMPFQNNFIEKFQE